MDVILNHADILKHFLGLFCTSVQVGRNCIDDLPWPPGGCVFFKK